MIKIDKLSKKYGDRIVLDEANYEFRKVGLVCLLGASGSGKSTLFNVIAGLDCCYDGDICVDGASLREMGSDTLCAFRRENIGFVFQDYHLLKGFSVLENVLLPIQSADQASSEQDKATELIRKLGISEKTAEKIENLSGGQKQRVAIARALINNPSIILADEPTGALDRKNANEIMKLLKEISVEKLVIVITHDNKISEYADEIITIENGKIVPKNMSVSVDKENKKSLSNNKKNYKDSREKEPLINEISENIEENSNDIPIDYKRNSKKINAKNTVRILATKNFKVKIGRYIAIALAVAFAISCFMLSLSAGNISEKDIEKFQEKNSAFNNGYIKTEGTDDIFDSLITDERLTNVYRQYKISDISLMINEKKEFMAEKLPMPKATESMSYGIMPRGGKNEISLSPSLARKFSPRINELIGKTLTLTIGGVNYSLTICGIFNAGYDDFFVSSDIEKSLYKDLSGSGYSISYDVISFEDIVEVNLELNEKNIVTHSAAKEVEALQKTFKSVETLFLSLSLILLFGGLILGSIMLVKMQSARYNEMGLYAALGYSRKTILKMLLVENGLLAIMSVIFNVLLSVVAFTICLALKSAVIITPLQLFLSFSITAVAMIVISILASIKLIRTDPAIALRK